MRAADVANTLLDWHRNQRLPCSGMRVLALVYYAQGLYLANTGSALFEDGIYAQDTGPLVPEVARQVGFSRDADLCFRLTLHDGRWRQAARRVEDPAQMEFLHTLASSYQSWTDVQLFNSTHAPGMPWHQVKVFYGKDFEGILIPREMLQDAFLQMIARSPRL